MQKSKATSPKFLGVIVKDKQVKEQYIISVLSKFQLDNIMCFPDNATVSRYCQEKNILYSSADKDQLFGFVEFFSFAIVFVTSYFQAETDDIRMLENYGKTILVLVTK